MSSVFPPTIPHPLLLKPPILKIPPEVVATNTPTSHK